MQLEMDKYANIVDQMPFRRDVIMKTLDAEGYKLEDFDAICGRGRTIRAYPTWDLSRKRCSYQRY